MDIKIIVDLARIAENIESIKKIAGTKVLLMVKADGYGHGMLAVAKAMQHSVDMLGVATIEEALALRRAGIDCDILAAVVGDSEAEAAIKNDITIAVGTASLMRAIAFAANNENKSVKINVKIDTGMHRLGADEKELDDILSIAETNNIPIIGCYSHMRSLNDTQPAEFERLSGKVLEKHTNAMRHLASSSSLCKEELRYDMVRIGLSAYENAMTVLSEVIAVRTVRAGEHISYGTFRVENDTNIAIVFGGYADGIARENPSYVLLNGRICPVLGAVCMDMFAVDSGDMAASVGDTVTLLGGELPASEVADRRKTIEYTALTCWHGRADRIYVNDKSGSENVSQTKGVMPE